MSLQIQPIGDRETARQELAIQDAVRLQLVHALGCGLQLGDRSSLIVRDLSVNQRHATGLWYEVFRERSNGCCHEDEPAGRPGLVGNTRHRVAAKAVASHEDGSAIDVLVLAEQMNRLKGVVDGIVDDRQLFNVGHDPIAMRRLALVVA
jgi:hypothetical protein